MARYINADLIPYTEEEWACDDYARRFDIENIPAADVEPVVHGQWVDRYGGKYANHLYECSVCKETALFKVKVDELGKEHLVQALSAACPHCRAKMDLE